MQTLQHNIRKVGEVSSSKEVMDSPHLKDIVIVESCKVSMLWAGLIEEKSV